MYVRQAARELPTSSAAQGIWWNDWYQISIRCVGSAQRRPIPGYGQLKKNRPAMRSGRALASDLRDVGADVVRHDADPFELQLVHQGQHIGGVHLGARRARRPARRLLAVPEAAQIRCEQLEAIGEAAHAGRPGQPELRPAVQQQKRSAASRARDVDPDAVHRQAVRFETVVGGVELGVQSALAALARHIAPMKSRLPIGRPQWRRMS